MFNSRYVFQLSRLTLRKRPFDGISVRRMSTRHFVSNSKIPRFQTRNLLFYTTLTAASLSSFYLYSDIDGPCTISNEAITTRLILPEEVAKHKTPDDCWVVINGYVYDITSFIMSHPGGPDVLETNAGKDVTAIFVPLHAPGVLEKYLPRELKLGKLQGSMPEELVCPPYAPGETKEDIMRKENLRANLPPLESILNLYDFERLASLILSNQAWAYYSSAADDEITLRENHLAYHRLFFKPRVLVDVSNIDLKTEMLGEPTEVPFYVTATALCKLGNPNEGEKDIARGCGLAHKLVPQMLSTLASCSPDEVAEAKVKSEQLQWYQLYINSDRKITRNLVKHVEELGYKAIFVTVDAPLMGSREKDLKIKFSTTKQGPKIMKETEKLEDTEKVTHGASQALSEFIDPSITWKDIKELQKITKLPIVIKGIQRREDVIKAAEVGCSGVVLSNHGGRQLDFSRAPIEVLAETMPELKKRGLDQHFDVFIDGGIRRGTDIIKALCLGAKGVGLGRPFLYANSCYGKEGVAKAIELLTKEMETSMKLLGAQSVKDLNESFLDLSALHQKSVNVPIDSLYNDVYKAPTTIEVE
ncbi:hypothetical protein KAFR_0I00520 [Kazachstania africana CBS 2517]|uniref:L-lactate dehydrogenase (cytochrome) n=1 Tax=Kazachstania africana (strain ATCC 22294 / BCRC 22015 / CBS 2517 / CECT 1963 / NBRC 1671 / NRRL Y-8276) TaxID=1071382 RepID=H2AZN3_KAZAF|nr:hypothetical protein KAFR_0I00520 [Kazachstania africana CBS 2517]CCF59833.1 hypothetical protein KAFR_0I00520 [Kazachstania africana CBS 2517]